MKVKVFMWLLFDNKILTQEILITRECTVTAGCHMCNSSMMETRDHLIWECGFATTFWTGLCASLNISIRRGGDMVEEWIKGQSNLPPRLRKLWITAWAAGV